MYLVGLVICTIHSNSTSSSKYAPSSNATHQTAFLQKSMSMARYNRSIDRYLTTLEYEQTQPIKKRYLYLYLYLFLPSIVYKRAKQAAAGY